MAKELAEVHSNLPAEYVDFGEDAGAGFDNLRPEDMSTPWLRIIQSNSKVLKKNDAKYIPGASQGQLYNTLTQELYDEPVEIIFCAAEPCFTEWTRISDGGGFHGVRPITDEEAFELVKTQGKFPKERLKRGFERELMTPAGTQLVEQKNVYALYGPAPITVENQMPVMIAFTSTKLGRINDALTIARGIVYPGHTRPAPLYAHRWTLEVVGDQRDNNPFFNFKLQMANGASKSNPQPALVPYNTPLYNEAKRFAEMVSKGTVKVDFAESATVEVDDNIPF